MNKKFLDLAKIIILAAALTIGMSYAYAIWSVPPAGTPPTCPADYPGCDAPINESIVAQIKRGGLGIAGFFSTKEKAVVGHGTAAPTIADVLKFKVFGKVGAEAYCDQDGNNCTTPPFGAGGGFWRQVNTSDRIENTNAGRVDINGKVKIMGGEPARNKVLASNGEGVGNWKTLAELGVGGDFKVSCGTGEAIQAIDTSKTPPVTCIKLSSGSTGGGFFNWNFSFLGGGGSGGSSYSTTCSIDQREATCRPNYTRVQVVNCGTEMVNNIPWPKTYAVCEPNNQ